MLERSSVNVCGRGWKERLRREREGKGGEEKREKNLHYCQRWEGGGKKGGGKGVECKGANKEKEGEQGGKEEGRKK